MRYKCYCYSYCAVAFSLLMARLILLFLLMPVLAFAQNAVSGKVSAADSKAPLAHASVFLSNSSIGTSTAADGSFTLSGLKPGQYTLIVTTAGYENNAQTILVNNAPVKLNIELSPKIIELKGVTISTITKADRKLALEHFKTDFIGDDANAADCKIINPEVLNFSFRQNKNILNANTDDFLIVENRALGYRLKFQITSFTSNVLTGAIGFKGERLFEELQGTEAQKKKWYVKRDEAYYGSAMHFYRALYNDSLEAEGFKIYRLTRVINPNRPSETEIQQNLDKAKDDVSSFNYWTNVKQLSRYASQTLANTQWAAKSIVRKTDHPGLLALVFPDYLYVVYTKKWQEGYFKDLYRAPDNLNYATTIVSFTGDNNYAAFDANGAMVGVSPLYEGTWADARLSAMLPVNYTPHSKKQPVQ